MTADVGLCADKDSPFAFDGHVSETACFAITCCKSFHKDKMERMLILWKQKQERQKQEKQKQIQL